MEREKVVNRLGKEEKKTLDEIAKLVRTPKENEYCRIKALGSRERLVSTRLCSLRKVA